jgi:hypothetical protein
VTSRIFCVISVAMLHFFIDAALEQERACEALSALRAGIVLAGIVAHRPK